MELYHLNNSSPAQRFNKLFTDPDTKAAIKERTAALCASNRLMGGTASSTQRINNCTGPDSARSFLPRPPQSSQLPKNIYLSTTMPSSRPQRTRRQISQLQVGLSNQPFPPASNQLPPHQVSPLLKPETLARKNLCKIIRPLRVDVPRNIPKILETKVKEFQSMARTRRTERSIRRNLAKKVVNIAPYKYKKQCMKKTNKLREEEIKGNDKKAFPEKIYPSLVTYDSDLDDWYRPWPPAPEVELTSVNEKPIPLQIYYKVSSGISHQEHMKQIQEDESMCSLDAVVHNSQMMASKELSGLPGLDTSMDLLEAEVDNGSELQKHDLSVDKAMDLSEPVPTVPYQDQEAYILREEDEVLGPLGDHILDNKPCQESSSLRRDDEMIDLLEVGVRTSPTTPSYERTEKVGHLADGENDIEGVYSKDTNEQAEYNDNTTKINNQDLLSKKPSKINIDHEKTDSFEESNKNVRYINNWFPILKKKQLYIEGDLLNFSDDLNVSRSRYVTSRIVSRISERRVASKKSLYVLEGPLTIPEPEATPMPLFVIDKFKHGFPENWETSVDIWSSFSDQNVINETRNQTSAESQSTSQFSFCNSMQGPEMLMICRMSNGSLISNMSSNSIDNTVSSAPDS